MAETATCLWFDERAEEAARFYVSLLPNSRIDHVAHYVADSPGPKAGDVMLVSLTLAGNAFQLLNGGPFFRLTPAASISVVAEDQAEVDRLWNALLEGGAPSQCGWLTDRYGLSWQIVPRGFVEMIHRGEPERVARATAAMMAMVKLDMRELQRAYDGD